MSINKNIVIEILSKHGVQLMPHSKYADGIYNAAVEIAQALQANGQAEVAWRYKAKQLDGKWQINYSKKKPIPDGKWLRDDDLSEITPLYLHQTDEVARLKQLAWIDFKLEQPESGKALLVILRDDLNFKSGVVAAELDSSGLWFFADNDYPKFFTVMAWMYLPPIEPWIAREALGTLTNGGK